MSKKSKKYNVDGVSYVFSFNDDAADTNGFYPGQLYFFTYSAQTKQPYYDMYPLSYIIEYQKGGFLGCNIHYLSLIHI